MCMEILHLLDFDSNSDNSAMLDPLLRSDALFAASDRASRVFTKMCHPGNV